MHQKKIFFLSLLTALVIIFFNHFVQVERHAIAEHCPLSLDVDIPCMWARCDGMKRKRFSLMTHLQDRHCHPQVLISGVYIFLFTPRPPAKI